jgi:hypothetical protein
MEIKKAGAPVLGACQLSQGLDLVVGDQVIYKKSYPETQDNTIP